ncbi:MAG: Amino acid/amide transporter rane protein 1, family /amino acid/amide transporter rane [Subtercola sp.]|nr:Amino acid/amide transporter rane protein 1, family /amino acid/amide transporter rane [Subtercola sp.]
MTVDSALTTEVLRFAILGMASGAMYALVALGVVVSFKASRVLNFAAGASGALAAFVFYSLRDDMGIPSVVALIASLVLGGIIGAGTALLLRWLKKGSQLTRLIATVALLTLLQGVMNLIWGGNGGQPMSILPTNRIAILPGLEIPIDRLILTASAIVLAIGLWLLYTKSVFGLATSAVAESRFVTSASGWSPTKLELTNFAIAGVLSALAAILLAPILTLSSSVLALTVIPALAAALVGRFQSFAITVIAAIGIGVLQSELSYFQTNIADAFKMDPASLVGLPEMVPLVIIIVVLVLTGRSRPGRGESSESLPLPGPGILRPGTLAIAIAIGVALLVFSPDSWANGLIITFGFTLVVLSVVVVTGFAGQLSLAQFALAGAGCWAAALVGSAGWPFEIAFVVGLVVATATGLLVALLSVRTRGVNFAIVTLGLASVLEAMVFTNPALTGGFEGLTVASPSVFGIDLDPILTPRVYGAFALVVIIVVSLILVAVRRARRGREMLAVRGNERAAASLGINVVGAKLFACALAGVVAGAGGIILGFRSTHIQLNFFDVFGSMEVVLFSVFGGVGWVSGAPAGALSANGGIVTQILNTIFPGVGQIDYWLLVVAGLNVLVILRVAPDGLAAVNSESLNRLRDRWRTRRTSAREAGRRSTPAVEALAPPASDARPDATLEVRNVTVRFGGLVALDSISFRVNPGEIVGLMGPNGAGKTTMLDVITGFTSPTSGEVYFDGRPISKFSPHARARDGLVRSWQGVELFNEMTVRENLLVSRSGNDRARNTNASRKSSKGERALAGIIADFGLEPYLDSRPSSLPHGVARLVGIGRAVACRPRMLLLDEPAAGLDDTETAELAELLHRLAQNLGIGILIIEHDMSLLRATCSRLIVLDFGRFVIEGPPVDVLQHSDVVRAYLGEAPADEELRTGATPVVSVPVTGGAA